MCFFVSSRRRHTRFDCDWSSDVCSSDLRPFDSLCQEATASASSEDLITPGRFEFELSRRSSVLIFTMEGHASSQRNEHVGAFLAGLIQDDSTSGRDLVSDCGCGTEATAELVAACKQSSFRSSGSFSLLRN